MTAEKIEQAKASLDLLDRAAAMASVTRQDHVNIQTAVHILRAVVADAQACDEVKNSVPRCLPGPVEM